MKYRIAIPSYKRSDIIQEKTLKYLKECNIPSNIIDIFVANKEEYEIYKKNIPSNLYNKIIIGKLGYHNIKNEIAKYYPKNTKIVHFDDDVKNLNQLKQKNKKETLTEFYNLNELTKYGFYLMQKYNSTLLGFSPTNNTFYMDNTLGIGLYFCIGNCYLEINTKEIKLKYPDYTDYELSLKTYLLKKKVLRLNNIVAVTNYASTPGGTKEYRNHKLQKKIIEELLTKYPEYIQYNKKPDKPYQIKFKRQKNNKKVKL